MKKRVLFKKYSRNKFGAVRAEREGQSFHSKAEARYYDWLVIAREQGKLVFFLRQVPFHLPGGVIYRVDFQEFWDNGDIFFVDVKGVETALGKLKIRQVEALYPVNIIIKKR